MRLYAYESIRLVCCLIFIRLPLFLLRRIKVILLYVIFWLGFYLRLYYYYTSEFFLYIYTYICMQCINSMLTFHVLIYLCISARLPISLFLFIFYIFLCLCPLLRAFGISIVSWLLLLLVAISVTSSIQFLEFACSTLFTKQIDKFGFGKEYPTGS